MMARDAITENDRTTSDQTTIHSGHFMVSCVHEESEDPAEVPQNSVKYEDGRQEGYNFENANLQPSNSYQFGSRSTNHRSIDASLAILFQHMTLAYSGKLTSPKWKNFKGIKVNLKEKIRLNNIIWREWYMQYICKKKPFICQFDTPISERIHLRPEAVVLEGKYWKRRLQCLTTEYKKWRMFFKERFSRVARDHQMEEVASHSELLERIARSNSTIRLANYYVPDPTTNLLYEEQLMMTEDDYIPDFASDDTLFSSLNQPFPFPDPREISQLGFGDIIQPHLIQLQPSLDESMEIDNLAPLPILNDFRMINRRDPSKTPALSRTQDVMFGPSQSSRCRSSSGQTSQPKDDQFFIAQLQQQLMAETSSYTQPTTPMFFLDDADDLPEELPNDVPTMSDGTAGSMYSCNVNSAPQARSPLVTPIPSVKYVPNPLVLQQQQQQQQQSQMQQHQSHYQHQQLQMPLQSPTQQQVFILPQPQLIPGQNQNATYCLVRDPFQVVLQGVSVPSPGSATSETGSFQVPSPLYAPKSTSGKSNSRGKAGKKSLSNSGSGQFTQSAVDLADVKGRENYDGTRRFSTGSAPLSTPPSRAGRQKKHVRFNCQEEEQTVNAKNKLRPLAPATMHETKVFHDNSTVCDTKNGTRTTKHSQNSILQQLLEKGKDGNQSSTSSPFALVSSFKARNPSGSTSTVTNNAGHSSSSSWMNSGSCGSQNISNFLSSNIFGQSSNPPNFMSNNPCGQMNIQNSMNTSLCRQANVQIPMENNVQGRTNIQNFLADGTYGRSTVPQELTSNSLCDDSSVQESTSNLFEQFLLSVNNDPVKVPEFRGRSTPMQTAPPTCQLSSAENAESKPNIAKQTTDASITKSSSVTDFQKSLLIAAATHAIGIEKHEADRVSSSIFSERKSLFVLRTDFSDMMSKDDNLSGPSSVRSRHSSNESARPDDSRDNKRNHHTSAEHQRRCNIKYGFDRLNQLVPDLANSGTRNINKATTLQKSAECCKRMTREKQKVKEQIEAIEKQKYQLEADISALQSQLPESGVEPVARMQTSQMTQLFEDYVKSRTMVNWKFFIFSLIIRPLFLLYNDSVTTSSNQEMCQTVLGWSRQHCSLNSLRQGVTTSLRNLCMTTTILSDPASVPQQAQYAVSNRSAGGENDRQP